MTPKWQKLASLAQEICTLWFQFFGAVFASKGYPFKNIFDIQSVSATFYSINLSEKALINTHYYNNTGPRSAVGNVSGYRCVSDCRSRGREFDPGPVPYFRGDWS